MSVSNELLGKTMVIIGKRLMAGNCEMTQEQRDLVFGELEKAMDVPISKEEACSMLGISRSTFDAKIAQGLLPEGQHRRGFKEKVWYRNQVKEAAKK